MAKPTKQEVEQLKQQLNEKVGEFRDIYNKVVEMGGEELPEDILDTVTGGAPPVDPTIAWDKPPMDWSEWASIKAEEAANNAQNTPTDR